MGGGAVRKMDEPLVLDGEKVDETPTLDIRVGTCSWTDRTLLASGFYPKYAATPAARLAFYATQFRTVEVNSSYYALLDPANAIRWIAGTPKGFSFGVKSFSTFTFHRAKFSSLPAWLKADLNKSGRERAPGETVRRDELSHEQRVRLFEEFIAPVKLLHQAGKLAYLLFQFPPHWRFSREGLGYLRTLREISGPLPLAVEVRNRSWLETEGGRRERFLRALRTENMAYVAVDEPQIGWTVPPEWHLTAEWGTVVRFHGRNVPGWRNSRATVHERFKYRYAPRELAAWTARIPSLSEQRKRGAVYLMFNNCVDDDAVHAAKATQEMLGIDEPLAGSQSSLGLADD